ncbi:MAG: YcxB family protein [Armatimonadota bacterium]
MKLTYQLEAQDLVAFNLFHAAHSPLLRNQRWRQRFFFPIVYLLLAGVSLFVQAYAMSAMFAVVSILWFLLAPGLLQRYYRSVITKYVHETVDDSLKDPVVLELGDDGIHSTSYLGQTVYNYSAVGEVGKDSEHTYIYIGKGMALVLPKDRIPAEQITAFVAEVEARKTSAIPV